MRLDRGRSGPPQVFTTNRISRHKPLHRQPPSGARPSAMATAIDSHRLSDALVSFSLHGHFPDYIAELPSVSETDLEPAIGALATTKNELEVRRRSPALSLLLTTLQAQIHAINQETKDDVSSWVRNAKSLQDDIIRSKIIANDILRQAEAPQISGETIQDAEAKAAFLSREVQYSQELHGVLRRIQNVTRLLGDVERATDERRVLDSLRLLEREYLLRTNAQCLENAPNGRLRVMDSARPGWRKQVLPDNEAFRLEIFRAQIPCPRDAQPCMEIPD